MRADKTAQQIKILTGTTDSLSSIAVLKRWEKKNKPLKFPSDLHTLACGGVHTHIHTYTHTKGRNAIFKTCMYNLKREGFKIFSLKVPFSL